MQLSGQDTFGCTYYFVLGAARVGGSSHSGTLHARRPSMALTATPVQAASIGPASFERIRLAQAAASPAPSRNARASCCSVWWTAALADACPQAKQTPPATATASRSAPP